MTTWLDPRNVIEAVFRLYVWEVHGIANGVGPFVEHVSNVLRADS